MNRHRRNAVDAPARPGSRRPVARSWQNPILAAAAAAFLAIAPVAAQAAGDKITTADCGGAQADRPAATDRAVAAANGLGFDLLRSLADDKPGENVAISPYSIFLALGLAHMGAAGGTADAMASSMHVSGLDSFTLGLANAWTLNHVRCGGGEGADVRIANGLWLADGFEARVDYLARAQSQYRAEVAALDFASGDPAAPINAWVRERTAGKIENAVARVPPLTVLMIVNTVYFKGRWTAPFDSALTEDAPFHKVDGSDKAVAMMRFPMNERRLPYFEGDGVQSLRLAYGDDEALHMALFLPEAGRTRWSR